MIMRVKYSSQTSLDGLSQDMGLLGAAGPHQRQHRKMVKTDLVQRHRQEQEGEIDPSRVL